MKRITQVLYSGLGGHGSVAFSIIDGDIHHRCQHQLLFFGIEPVKNEYINNCKNYNINFDAVILNNLPKYKALYQAFKKIIAQKPTVVILHSIALFPIVPILRLKGIKVISVDHTSKAAKTRFGWICVFFLNLFSNTQVYLTKVQLKDTFEYFGKLFMKLGHPVIINNGIDTQLFSQRKPINQNPPFQLIAFGRFIKIKDFQTIIRATKILKEQSVPDFHVYLAGDGETFEECKNLSKELSLEKEITFLGMQPESALREYLQKTHLYIHSSFSENMSTAIMQAMSCGVPCLVSDIPGNRALIKENETGWFFETNHPEDLAKKIEQFLNNQLHPEEIAQNARKYAKENLSMIKMFDNYYNFI